MGADGHVAIFNFDIILTRAEWLGLTKEPGKVS